MLCKSAELGFWRDAINRVCTGVWRDAINRVQEFGVSPCFRVPFIVSLFTDGNNNALVGHWHNCFYLSYDERQKQK
ncbi:MAG: hypothetical protein ACYTXY_18705, partial [Nostoc sp.]